MKYIVQHQIVSVLLSPLHIKIAQLLCKKDYIHLKQKHGLANSSEESLAFKRSTRSVCSDRVAKSTPIADMHVYMGLLLSGTIVRPNIIRRQEQRPSDCTPSGEEIKMERK